jgi:serine/threonine-protein kinase
VELQERLGSALADRYDVESEIGRGGMAVVLRARDRRHARTVAIKVLRPEIAAAVGLDRFEREIRIDAQLQHPHILSLFDSGAADGLPFFVMPFVEGESLRARMRREGALPLDDALRIADQVADALGYAHARGVVHRDIKPENILLSGDHAFVADFGIARVIYEGGETYFTATGTALGTPPYMSPEQATAAGHLDGRSDLYSLACVLFEMLAGEPPFTGGTAQAVIAKHLLEPPPSLEIVRPTVPPVVNAAILKGLAKQPVDRFTTAAEFRAALRADRPVAVPRPGRRARTRRRVLAAGVTTAALAAGTVAWRLFHQPGPRLVENRVVVFPLAATAGGSDAAEQGWNAALAIENALERTEPLRWLDGWSLLPADVRNDPSRLTQEAARAISRAAGARYFITGAIRGDTAGPSVTLWLHDAAADSVVAPVTQAGIGTSVALLAIGAVERLLGRLLEPGRTVDLTPLTQRAQGAIALTLQGDRAYRQARFVEALDLYKRAVAEDSLSALSAVKGAFAASWAARAEQEAWPLLDVALRADSLLPAKHQAFARGLRSYFLGDGDAAAAEMRRALQADREWAEAWMALGEVYYHLIPRATNLDSVAEDAFRRASVADSLFSPPLVHLAEISARRGDVQATRRFVERFRRIGTDSTYARELRFLLGCMERGPAALSDADLADSVGVTLAAMHLAAGGWRMDCAEAGFRRMLAMPDLPPAHRTGLALGMQGVLMARGRYAELAAFLDSSIAAGYRGAYALYTYDDALGAPVERGSAEAERLAREAAGELYERAQPANRWLLALWHLRRGGRERAAGIAAALDRVADSTGNPLDRLLADALAGHVTLALGDTTTALDYFGRLHADFPDLRLTWYPVYTIAPTRLLQADVLLARGRPAEADSVIAVLDRATMWASLAALPRVLALRAEIADASGRTRAAREYRARLERLRAPR